MRQADEVPTARWIGKPSRMTRMGTSRAPPPSPVNPDKMPMKNPMTRNQVTDPRGSQTGHSRSCQTMRTAMMRINTAKKSRSMLPGIWEAAIPPARPPKMAAIPIGTAAFQSTAPRL